MDMLCTPFSYQNRNDEHFVEVTADKLTQNGEVFFSRIINYNVNLREISGQFIVGPAAHYEDIKRFESNTAEENYRQVDNHFQLIRKMGFNTIRITGMGKMNYTDFYPELGIVTFLGNHEYRPLLIKDREEEILSSIWQESKKTIKRII